MKINPTPIDSETRERLSKNKLWDTRVSTFFSNLSIEFEVAQIGHAVPLPMSTVVMVTFYGNKNMTVYSSLDVENDAHAAHVMTGTIGIINQHRYHIDDYDLMKGHISYSRTASGRPQLSGVRSMLWYLVEFEAGKYWVRFDWLEPYLPPA